MGRKPKKRVKTSTECDLKLMQPCRVTLQRESTYSKRKNSEDEHDCKPSSKQSAKNTAILPMESSPPLYKLRSNLQAAKQKQKTDMSKNLASPAEQRTVTKQAKQSKAGFPEDELLKNGQSLHVTEMEELKQESKDLLDQLHRGQDHVELDQGFALSVHGQHKNNNWISGNYGKFVREKEELKQESKESLDQLHRGQGDMELDQGFALSIHDQYKNNRISGNYGNLFLKNLQIRLERCDAKTVAVNKKPKFQVDGLEDQSHQNQNVLINNSSEVLNGTSGPEEDDATELESNRLPDEEGDDQLEYESEVSTEGEGIDVLLMDGKDLVEEESESDRLKDEKDTDVQVFESDISIDRKNKDAEGEVENPVGINMVEPNCSEVVVPSPKKHLKQFDHSFKAAHGLDDGTTLPKNPVPTTAKSRTVLSSKQKEGLHVCPVCGERLAGPSQLKRHSRLHEQNLGVVEKGGLFNCVICGLKYQSFYSLQNHMMSFHQRQYVMSDDDDGDDVEDNGVTKNERVRKPERTEFSQRRKTSAPETVRKSERTECSQRRKTSAPETVRKPEQTDCSQSCKSATLKEKLCGGQRSMDQFPCAKCGVVFTLSSLLKKHQLDDDCSKKICTKCGVQYNDAESLKRHYQLHEEAENSHFDQSINLPTAVQNCQQSLGPDGKLHEPSSDSQTSIENGIKIISFSGELGCVMQNAPSPPRNEIQLRSCDFCPSVFNTAVRLLQHMRKCHRIKKRGEKHMCEVCGTSYIYRFWLERHRLSHTVAESVVVVEQSAEIEQRPLTEKDQNGTEEGEITGRENEQENTASDSHNDNGVETTDGTSQKTYVCDQCDRTFWNSDELLHHKMAHRQDECLPWYWCPKCGIGFQYPTHLARHLTLHSYDQPEKCSACKKTFQSMADFKNHYSEHVRFQTHLCDLCSKNFSTKASLKQHRYLHAEERRFKCDRCPKAFYRGRHLVLHKQTHSGMRPHCDKCGKSFGSSGALKTHMYLHNKERPYKCDVCPKAFQSPRNLKAHVKMHSDVKRKAFYCKICNKNFAAACSLKTHLKLHDSQKESHVCKLCDKSFASLESLRVHKVLHSNERPFSCCVCDRTFKLRSNLKMHLLVHSQTGKEHICKMPEGECIFAEFSNAKALKLYICTVCGKGCNSRNKLRVHMVTHTGEKMFLCSLCGQSFTSNGCLKVHMRVHTGAKPYVCKFCGQLFRQLGNLNIHEKLHTGEKPYQCVLCSKSFRIHYRLKLHLKTHGPSEFSDAPEYRIKKRFSSKDPKQTTNKKKKKKQNKKSKKRTKKKESDEDSGSDASFGKVEYGSVKSNGINESDESDGEDSSASENEASVKSCGNENYLLLHDEHPGEPIYEEIVE